MPVIRISDKQYEKLKNIVSENDLEKISDALKFVIGKHYENKVSVPIVETNKPIVQPIIKDNITKADSKKDLSFEAEPKKSISEISNEYIETIKDPQMRIRLRRIFHC